MRYIMPHAWYLCPPSEFVIHAAPDVCVKMLGVAAKPSVKRLHLSNIFLEGRRYRIHSQAGGFRITTTSKVFWHYRRRTRSTAILFGRFIVINDTITRIQVDARIRMMYLLQSFFLPTFMASILVFLPWSSGVIAGFILLLYGLSWFGHRYNAMAEAYAMVWFLRRGLETVAPAETPVLGKHAHRVYDAREFDTAWQKFVDLQQTKDEE